MSITNSRINSHHYRQVTLYTVLIAMYAVFHKPFETLFSNTIINYLFRHVESNWLNDLILLLISIVSITISTIRFNQYTPNKNLLTITTIICGIYLVYRFLNPVWTFTSFYFYSEIKYTDVLILTTATQLILLINNKSTNKINEKEAFLEDAPIDTIESDSLGYNSYAKLIANKINASNLNNSFAIGIHGKWGIGKTSFINLIKKNLNESNFIEVNFNPWNCNSPNAIILDFFETLQEAIKPYHSTLAKLLTSYATKLVKINDNTITQTIQTSINTLIGFESIIHLVNDINDILPKINKRVIIFIDDIDRLDKDEIIEVLRLIRNTANFKNTFFVAAYDRNYVINALKTNNKFKQEIYLEKIFQIEITLPYFKNDILRYTLSKNLKSKLPITLHKEIDKEILGTSSTFPIYLNEWLESIRDVTRISNTLVLNLTKLQGEIVFNDFLRLEILRLKYPSVYELLFKKTSIYLETINNSEKESHYRLKKILNNSHRNAETPINNKTDTFLELDLIRYNTDLSVPNSEVDKIINFINNIFSEDTLFDYTSRSHLSVIYPSKFYRYFAYNLLEGSLSEIEFSKSRDLTQNEFNQKITEWISQGLQIELINRFKEIKSFDNKDDFEKIILGIFHLAKQKSHIPNIYPYHIVGYDGRDLYDKLNNYDNILATRLYGQREGETKIREFLINIFRSAKSPFTFESEFIRSINKDRYDSFPLTHQELQDINIDYLRQYCNTTYKFDEHVLNLFLNCRQIQWTIKHESSNQKQEKMPEKAIGILKDFVLAKDLDGFIIHIIDPEPFEGKKFAINNLPVALFGNWDKFESILKTQDINRWDYLEEFIDLLDKYKSTGYVQYIEFKFNKIPMQTNTGGTSTM